MPELEITDEQASYLDDLRDAIESEIVGPYGTVRRKDALQYLMDTFGAPDELGDGAEPGGSVDETGDEDVEDDAAGEDEDDDEADADGTDEGAEPEDDEDGNGDDDMLNEMMSLLDTHDDKWTEADTEETKYEVDLPDGETETVQTKDDVRALLFKNYR
ncbi:MAG: hypothetical protein ACOCSN_07315 [Halanaeroarchaeum sp.]